MVSVSLRMFKDEIKGLIWVNNHITNKKEKSGHICLWDCLGRRCLECVEEMKSLVG